jgi:uncharacterized protein YdiU (UPF0061 family)
LIRAWLELMHRNECDFTLTFRKLCAAADAPDGALDEPLEALFRRPDEYRAWAREWRARQAREASPAEGRGAAMRRVNPAFIPRNHRVEAMISAAVERADYAPFEELLEVLSRPYEDQPRFEAYERPPRPEERVLQTFCGT